MAQRTIPGSEALAKKIRSRRRELGLTIEEAAARAGVGTKTWCRYEAGASIRQDKGRAVCKALNWRSLPEQEAENPIQEYRKHGAWSTFLEKQFGAGAAASFAAGSDILYDYISGDMKELRTLPAGTHIGQLAVSCLSELLPEQFLMQYDYNFLYQMKCTLVSLQNRAKAGTPMTAHSVLEELLLYLSSEEGQAMLTLGIDTDELQYGGGSDGWVFDLFDDMDIVSCLYSDMYLKEDHIYHFVHWTEQQFYTR